MLPLLLNQTFKHPKTRLKKVTKEFLKSFCQHYHEYEKM